MGFLDGLGKNLQQKGQAAIKATKDATETISLKSQISTEKSNIQNFYQEIGALAYTSNLTATQEAYEQYFNSVKAAEEKIEELQAEITKIEGTKFCAHCQSKLPADAKACPQCGTFIQAPVVEPTVVEATVEEAE